MSTIARLHRRSAALVLAAVLLLLGLAGSAPADSRVPPRTGFETRGGSSWTTGAEEADFLDAVRGRGGRAEIRRIGTTRQGRPLRLVRLGRPPAPEHPVLLLICGQHGDEPAGREACLSTVRDLAFTEHTPTGTQSPARRAREELLRRTTVLVLPTANPDGFALGTRNNSENADVNRDHIVLRTAEARAIAGVLRDYRPDLVVDLHEYHALEPQYTSDLLALWPRHPGVDAGVRAASRALVTDRLRPAAERAGLAAGVYGLWLDPASGRPMKQVAGDGQETMLRNAVGLKHSLGVLVETRVNPPGTRIGERPALLRRVRSEQVAVREALAFMARERGAVAAATAAAWRHGADPGPLVLAGADNAPPAKGETITRTPCGYWLSREQFTQTRERLALHGIEVHPRREGGLVLLDQPLRRLVPLLLDRRARFHLAAAAPVRVCS
ncbi:M14 family zinc carboxypeptidase [Streptomyces polyrhachis]|uniref:M14 family zinc carboxypeptidase n=1 Tax=Streptomyces polyrhachis TaxID=1282885 RepID=A0ABW2G9U3_9ACTN